jgi:hypothetical protein
MREAQKPHVSARGESGELTKGRGLEIGGETRGGLVAVLIFGGRARLNEILRISLSELEALEHRRAS